jgi:predicted nucleic acid-binding protein
MIVVADTSPINYLICIGEIDILARLYGVVIIPRAVRDELSRDRAPEMVRRWIAGPPAWLEVRIPTIKPDAALIAAELDAGEFDAILLAEELGASELIRDDRDGRKEAERRHAHPFRRHSRCPAGCGATRTVESERRADKSSHHEFLCRSGTD